MAKLIGYEVSFSGLTRAGAKNISNYIEGEYGYGVSSRLLKGGQTIYTHVETLKQANALHGDIVNEYSVGGATIKRMMRK
jgi:hypothetical protein